jgi:hypothetical protein
LRHKKKENKRRIEKKKEAGVITRSIKMTASCLLAASRLLSFLPSTFSDLYTPLVWCWSVYSLQRGRRIKTEQSHLCKDALSEVTTALCYTSSPGLPLLWE